LTSVKWDYVKKKLSDRGGKKPEKSTQPRKKKKSLTVVKKEERGTKERGSDLGKEIFAGGGD